MQRNLCYHIYSILEGRRLIYKLCDFIEDPKQSMSVKGGMFRRNGENYLPKDASDEWTNFVYRKLFFYQDYWHIMDPDGDGLITELQVVGMRK